MSMPDYYKFFEVLTKASFKAFYMTVFENFLIVLLLRKKYSIFSGRISLMKSETKCPLSPCPSQTPKRYLSFIIKFQMMIYESWLILSFLSMANPFLLQKAYFAMRLRAGVFLFLVCYARSCPHSSGDILIFSCDFVLVCLGFLRGQSFSCLVLSFIQFWCFPKALIVFLCNFFFLESGLPALGFPKKFKFFIYILMLILGDLPKVASAELLLEIFSKSYCLGRRDSFESDLRTELGFLGVKNLRYLVYWKYFSLKLLFLEGTGVPFLDFGRLVYFM